MTNAARIAADSTARTTRRHGIVPPYLLAHLAALDDPAMAAVADAARMSLLADAPLRDLRVHADAATAPRSSLIDDASEPGPVDRSIFDAAGTESLPGALVRAEGAAASNDVAVNEAYDGLGATHALFAEVYGRASIDDRDLPLLATVHYGREYDNAFWDGERMVFGDGDGMVFTRFTASLSVIGHELAHGVTQYSADLTYQGQSGALNESISDVFGALVEQHSLGQPADEASWLIGVGLFTDQVQGSALRSMTAPGTAYDDDVLGKDPQPASMDDFIVTTDDNGGVHLNSGIPNRAFATAALAIGGRAWETVGQIWYDTIVSGNLPPDCSFARFAQATIEAAGTRFGDRSLERRAVVEGWSTVGVAPAA